MVREYIIPMNDETRKTYKVNYGGRKILATSVNRKDLGEFTVVPGFLSSGIYEKGSNKAALIQEVGEEEESRLTKMLFDKGFKHPINIWEKDKDGR